MKNIKRHLCLLLCTVMLISCVAVFAGCGETADVTDGHQTQNANTNLEGDTEEIDDRFLDVDYQEREFRIYTSTNRASAGMGNSNFLIEGTGESSGGLVNDAVVARNLMVEDLLGVELVFTQVDLDYLDVSGNLRRLTSSGTDEFDLVINDIWAFAEMTLGNHFRNVLTDECVFEFDRPYWYGEYMEDLRFVDSYQSVLAGDFFIDILLSQYCHYNVQLFA